MEKRTIQINDLFDITLKGKSTTGYKWHYTLAPENIISVEPKKPPVKSSSKPVPGASPDEIFTITGLGNGTATLHFYLARTWEKDSVAPVEEKDISITVE